ncbi:MAG: 3'-5' exonuclease domain-containing protein 2 [Magnetococcales bacterium]|nr:3'-5' exonuclease domain-containing protein 2 [Magnetococcales bacterium]
MDTFQSLRRKLSKDEINTLPVVNWKGRVELVPAGISSSRAIDTLSKRRVLGFDTETRPVFRKGVIRHPSLIQISDGERVVIFQLQQMKSLDGLVALFENQKILKVGVGVRNDCIQLQPVLPFKPKGFIDLGDIMKRHDIPSCGLRSMTACLFGKRISKRARCSNWEKKRLKAYQVRYAATDAWISRELYLDMKKRGLINAS